MDTARMAGTPARSNWGVLPRRPPMKQRLIAGLLAAMASAALAVYPEKPVTIVVPFAAGGPTDRVARDLGDVLRRQLKQPVIIENVGGAGGTLGAAKVAKAAPDGYTVLLHHIGMATAPVLYRKLSFDTLGDFEYLGMVNEVPMTLIGRKTLPANNMAELMQWIGANKGRINLANAGLGAASQLCGLLFQQAVKVTMTTVPYKGTAPAMTDLLGGQVDLMCDQTTNTSQQIEAGKVKAYAVSTAKRLTSPALARLPTLAESGFKGFNVSVWHGLYAPKGTPQQAIDTLNAALRAALKDPEFIRRQEALGAVIITDARLSPAEHRRFVQAEIDRWGPTIKAAGQHVN
jgi:tripartite-type tricarboxylate transporter receptor subunit TctC